MILGECCFSPRPITPFILREQVCRGVRQDWEAAWGSEEEGVAERQHFPFAIWTSLSAMPLVLEEMEEE